VVSERDGRNLAATFSWERMHCGRLELLERRDPSTSATRPRERGELRAPADSYLGIVIWLSLGRYFALTFFAFAAVCRWQMAIARASARLRFEEYRPSSEGAPHLCNLMFSARPYPTTADDETAEKLLTRVREGAAASMATPATWPRFSAGLYVGSA